MEDHGEASGGRTATEEARSPPGQRRVSDALAAQSPVFAPEPKPSEVTPQSNIWITELFALPEAIANVSWSYTNPAAPDLAEVLKEVSGRALTDLRDGDGQLLKPAGEQLDGGVPTEIEPLVPVARVIDGVRVCPGADDEVLLIRRGRMSAPLVPFEYPAGLSRIQPPRDVERRHRELTALAVHHARSPPVVEHVVMQDLGGRRMIELFDDRIDRAFELGEIDDPAELRIERTAHRHLAAERVAVNAPALVALRHVRQPVRGLEAKILHDLDDVGHRHGV